MPDAENPPPKVSESHEEPTAATHISTEEFHERADAYLNELVERLEEAQEKDPNIEVEYAVSSLIVKFEYTSLLMQTGGCSRSHCKGAPLCPQQAATKQADLAQLADFRS